ncbi:hypothetical protein BDZ97DRAFT_1827730 [Flammula alnicola]|nr:hypothetical protein BDZ97DRAFT_1827730 [Flammula alnicola]
MSPIISEILKIQVDPAFNLNSPAFEKLRDAAIKGGVKEQYYGLCMDEPDKLLWVIHWPGDANPAEYTGTQGENFRESVKALDVNSNPSSWYLPFESADLVRPALTAPICELCYVHITPPTSLVADSLHKTFTDCYLAPGFVGGYWSTALNDDKMNYYYLGWETREVCRRLPTAQSTVSLSPHSCMPSIRKLNFLL